jgi:hypothetical protein
VPALPKDGHADHAWRALALRDLGDDGFARLDQLRASACTGAGAPGSIGAVIRPAAYNTPSPAPSRVQLRGNLRGARGRTPALPGP